MFDDLESTIAFIVAILIAYGVILWLGIIVWAYRDIRERTRDGASQTIAALLVVLFNLPGLFLYLLLRPRETLTEAYERRLQNEALTHDLAEQRRSCPTCQLPVNSEFLVCPHCRAKLQEPCASCSRGLEPGWIACPYCGAQPGQSSLATAPPAAAPTPTAQTPPPALPAAEQEREASTPQAAQPDSPRRARPRRR